jgi:hypothetical protein
MLNSLNSYILHVKDPNFRLIIFMKDLLYDINTTSYKGLSITCPGILYEDQTSLINLSSQPVRKMKGIIQKQNLTYIGYTLRIGR